MWWNESCLNGKVHENREQPKVISLGDRGKGRFVCADSYFKAGEGEAEKYREFVTKMRSSCEVPLWALTIEADPGLINMWSLSVCFNRH